MNEAQLVDELTPILAQFDLELDALDVRPAGRRMLLRVTVDGDGPDGRGPSLDDIAEATQAISRQLDSSAAVGNATYTLEVSSRGVTRPLRTPAHWRRNLDRLVRVKLIAEHGVAEVTGDVVEARVSGATDDAVLLATERGELRLAYAVIDKAVVQVELTKQRPSEPTVRSR